MTYNGWTNYETWLVSLWIDNEQGSSQYLVNLIEEGGIEGIEDGSTASQIREWIEEGSPLNNMANLYSDLLNAALSEVDWQEIAKNHADDIDWPKYDEDGNEVDDNACGVCDDIRTHGRGYYEH